MSSTLAAYAERHAQTLVGAVGRMAKQPFSTLMIMAVIGIALALPLFLQVLIQNTRQASASWTEGLDLTVYLDTKASEDRARAIAAQLKANAEVASVRLVTATEALAEFRQHSGFGPALDVLKDNPLPNVIEVTPALAASSSEGTEGLRKTLSAIPDVANVQVDTAWVKRFHAILDIFKRLTSMVVIILGAGVVLGIGNTIRLDILNRRNEIEVMKLVGGSDGFARRPFLYTGTLVGCAGGLFAWSLVTLGTRLLSDSVEHLAGLYGSSFQLAGLGWRLGVATALGSALLGWIGSFIAATRHIRQIEPT